MTFASYIEKLPEIKVFSLPLVPKGGSMEPPKKTTFPLEFCSEICTIYVWTKTQKSQFWKKKKERKEKDKRK